ncbi:peroxidase-related enzyme [Intrasporangium calvum]|uniref:Peroxidase-related enzyme n=1 Tax=Intrasporangium calvum TaxID=53358 RepID=A0ABT5GKA5_9MICO|nr:peroxidase-related enzyme [Intrasporangium calvum]MDC5698320.1 peroxidase-related enzyme [Intrasporangium calvum]
MYIRGVDEAEAHGPVADYYESQRAMWGFLPNYAAAFSHRPEVAQAWAGLNLAIRGGMDRRRYELATIAAARARRSTYCTAAHATFLRDVCGDEDAVRAIAAHPDGSALDEQDRAIFEFATTVATDAAGVTEADVARLRDAGLSDPEIADVVLAVSARLFFATVLDGLGAELDPQTAATFPPEVLDAMIVGRPVAAPPDDASEAAADS